jgi:hypothetical protein
MMFDRSGFWLVTCFTLGRGERWNLTDETALRHLLI